MALPASKTFKFNITSAYMLAKMLINKHYTATPTLAHAPADVLAEQVRHAEAAIFAP